MVNELQVLCLQVQRAVVNEVGELRKLTVSFQLNFLWFMSWGAIVGSTCPHRSFTKVNRIATKKYYPS